MKSLNKMKQAHFSKDALDLLDGTEPKNFSINRTKARQNCKDTNQLKYAIFLHHGTNIIQPGQVVFVQISGRFLCRKM